MLSPYQVVTVFAKPDYALGNQAAVFLTEKNTDTSYAEQVSSGLTIMQQKGIATACFISSQNDEHYKVQCYNGSHPIQCCGHGLIAAAEALFNNTAQSEVILNNTVSAAKVNNAANTHRVKLTLPRMNSTLFKVPGWVKHLFTLNEQAIIPDNAAISESDDGYLLLDFKNEIDKKTFQSMQASMNKIIKNTQRAVVAISFNKQEKICFSRYFAPQYGNPEDSATGSVMRFVADYIDKKYQARQFEVEQCSAEGGFMKVSSNDKSVSIFSDVSTETAL